MAKVLVAYATKYGSTGEVAQRVGEKLRERGLEVDIEPAGSVSDVSRYSAVVLGAPYYVGRPLKDATRFLERNRVELEKLPVALFALGPLHSSDDMDEAREQLDRTLQNIGWLRPVAAEMFIGKYDPALLRGLDRLVSKPKASPLHGVGAVDERDWGAIERWADSIPIEAPVAP